jgi:peptide/nickel transport system substrate-binding protein
MFLKSLSPLIAMLALLSNSFGFGQNGPRPPGELAWAISYDPKTLDPMKVDDQTSELVRFLTGGVLVRVNRLTQQLEPELASSWTLSPDGKVLSFRLRDGLHFSDGSELSSRDVAWTLHRILAEGSGAPVAEEFLTPQQVKVETPDLHTVIVRLPNHIVGAIRIFDEISIEPMGRVTEGKITAGPFTVAEYRRGQLVRLRRNPAFWKHDVAGVQLPYATGVRLDIVSNREREVSLFQRGVYDLIDGLPAENFNALARIAPGSVRDMGPSLNTEQIWFNQSPNAPLPDFERAWFANRSFRVAVSQGIHRADLARIAYDGHATPAFGFVSPANLAWHNKDLQFPHEDGEAARKLLSSAGFHLRGNLLYDRGEHPIRFSILTNAGNAARQKMATLLQQDLAALGMQVTVVTLDFPALIERIMHTQNYEACLLGIANVDPDPNAMANIWLSSSPNHQWNPSEKTPATPWEAEIDEQVRSQAITLSGVNRKRAMDRLQQIVADQQPFIYLVHPNTLFAISPKLVNVRPAVLSPGLVWNIDTLRLQGVR